MAVTRNSTPHESISTKAVQIKYDNNFYSFQLHFIINFVLTEPKLAHDPVIPSATH